MINTTVSPNVYENGAWTPASVVMHFDADAAAVCRDAFLNQDDGTGMSRLLADARHIGQLLVVGGLVGAGEQLDNAVGIATAGYDVRTNDPWQLHFTGSPDLEQALGQVRGLESSEVIRLGVSTIALADQLAQFTSRRPDTSVGQSSVAKYTTHRYIAPVPTGPSRQMKQAFEMDGPVPSQLGVAIQGAEYFIDPGVDRLQYIDFMAAYSNLDQRGSHVSYGLHRQDDGSLDVSVGIHPIKAHTFQGVAFFEARGRDSLSGPTELAAGALWALAQTTACP